MPGTAMSPPMEVTAIRCPRRGRRMGGSAARSVATAPNTLTSNCRRTSASGVSSKVPSRP